LYHGNDAVRANLLAMSAPIHVEAINAEVLLGYRPEVSLADGIADQAAWVAAELGLTASRTVGT
jgi:hypothetical protein